MGARWPVRVPLFTLVLGGISLVLLIIAIGVYVRDKRFAARCTVADAVVEGLWQDTESSRDSLLVCFTAMDGKEVHARCQPMTNAEISQYPSGSVLRVAYVRTKTMGIKTVEVWPVNEKDEPRLPWAMPWVLAGIAVLLAAGAVFAYMKR